MQKKLVWAYEGDNEERPMVLNEDNTLGVPNFRFFRYSLPYPIKGFEYIDEFFTAANGITYVRVLFKNNLEPVHELSSQRQYYKLAEVIPYPQGIPGLVITPVHGTAEFAPWILQSWIFEQGVQENIKREQWLQVQFFLQQQHFFDEAAYYADLEIAKTKRALHNTKKELNQLKAENQTIKQKLAEQSQPAPVAPIKQAAQKLEAAPEPKVTKAQKQQIRRADILLRTSQISAWSLMLSKMSDQILNLLKNLQLNEKDRELFTENLNISIESCGKLLQILHKKPKISTTVKLAFLHKFFSFTDSELEKYAQENSTQKFVTMAIDFGACEILHDKIKSFNNNKIVNLNKNKMLEMLDAHLQQKQKDLPGLLLKQDMLDLEQDILDFKQTIIDLNGNDYVTAVNKSAELNIQSAAILKSLLPELSKAEPTKVKQFFADIKLPNETWIDIYKDPNTSGAVKLEAEAWVEQETKSVFESMARKKTNHVKIPKSSFDLFHDKTNDNNQTLLMVALEKSYPDKIIEQFFMHTRPNDLLKIDFEDQTFLHYLGNYKGNNYDLIQRMLDAFIKAVTEAKQHLYEIVHMKSDKNGGTFLHYILRGDDEDHACKMMRIFFANNMQLRETNDMFRTVIFEKNQNDETAAATLDLKTSEWPAARSLLYGLIPDLLFDYEFPVDYKYFFLTESSCTQLIELIFSDPLRVIEILDARTKLQIAAATKMETILKKTSAAERSREKSRLLTATAHLRFEMYEATMVPGTEMNIHRMLAQKICTEYDTSLEQKYKASIFYKTYNDIALRDTLLWNKFTHAYRVWEVSDSEDPKSPAYKQLNAAAGAFQTYLKNNPDQVPAAIECFFDLNESPGAFALIMKLCTHITNLQPPAYDTLFKYLAHDKFTTLFIRICKEIAGPEVTIFMKHVMQFVSQNPTKFGLLLNILNNNKSPEVTKEFLANINMYFTDYDTFLSAALHNDNMFLICNLLCQRDANTGRLTMRALCRVAIKCRDFEVMYKLLEMTKGAHKHRNWDPEADFLNLLFATAARSKSIPIVKTLISRFKPTITAGVILAVSDSEIDNSEPIYQEIMRLVIEERDKQIAATKAQAAAPKEGQANDTESHIIKILTRNKKLGME